MEVYRHIEKNKFGYNTWQIKLSSLFHIFINETDKGAFIVDFKEWKWISYKTHFSFHSAQNLEQTVMASFERVYTFFLNKKDMIWPEEYKNSQMKEALEIIKKRNQNNNAR